MKTPIKAIIIDDEAPARQMIQLFLKTHEQFEIVEMCEDGFSGAMAIKKHMPDVVFLDIQMPKLNGFEMLELLDQVPLVVFSTAYDEFALKAFEYGAVDYLLKPYSQKRFNAAIEKILIQLENKNLLPNNFSRMMEFVREKREIIHRIVVKTPKEIKIILDKEIVKIEAQDDYVFIYTESGGRFLKNITMKYLEEHLDNEEFIRVHRSFIIKIDQISKIENWEKDSYVVILKNKEKVSVSRSGYKKLREKLRM